MTKTEFIKLLLSYIEDYEDDPVLLAGHLTREIKEAYNLQLKILQVKAQIKLKFSKEILKGLDFENWLEDAEVEEMNSFRNFECETLAELLRNKKISIQLYKEYFRS